MSVIFENALPSSEVKFDVAARRGAVVAVTG